MDLPKGIERLSLQAGRLRVLASSKWGSENFALSVAGLELPLEAASDAAAVPFHMDVPLDPEALVRQASLIGSETEVPPREICTASLDTLPDWALADRKTIQLQVYRKTPAVELTLGDQVQVPPHAQPYLFSACLGLHRCAADLCVEVGAAQDGAVRRTVVPFDTGKRGGRNRAGYQIVTITIPPSAHPETLSLSVRYKGHRRDGEDSDNDAFLFVSQPEIASPGVVDTVLSGLHRVGLAVKDPTWYQISIPGPVVAGDPPLELIAGSQRHTVFEPQHIAVRIVHDHGHALVMTADRADRYTFFLNGTPAFAAQIGPKDSTVHIPANYMTGETYHLSVRDMSGTQVFLETYLLLPRILTPQDVMLRESRAPFPTSLSVQTSYRYAALKAHVAKGGPAAELAQISTALQVLEGGYDNVRLAPLIFPKVAKPDVSIVIPAFNKVEVTYCALCALLLAYNEASFEVIVVDDASTDATAELEKLVSGITVIHNAEPQRFIRACNAGVEKARGKYVVLLNNDTEPTAGWLDALIDAFDRFPGVGLAGAKLLYPDGTLQDAGGIIWASGNPWNYGNRANPWDPRYSYARQADYLSGAALMTTRAIWNEVGGLSTYLEPMYFEDTDFAFKVRKAGYTTWFVPSSVVYHHEGMTSGTDVSIGFKHYQEINRPKFKRRWAKAYAHFGPEGETPDLEKDRGIVGRALFIDYTTPRADVDAGGHAILQEMKLMQSLGYKVTFIPQNLAHLGSYTDRMMAEGIEVITAPFTMSMNEFIHHRGQEFDIVYIVRYYVAKAVMDLIRTVAPKAKILFNNCDLHFLREIRAGLAHKDADRVARARQIRDEELDITRRADVALSYNDVEQSVIQSHIEGAVPIMTCPWVVDIPQTVPPLEDREGLSFLGSFKHHPNAEGVRWFAEEVMPELATKLPDILLSIYGSGMNDEIRALKTPNIDPVGYVEDVADAYGRHRVFVAPLLSGAGMKGKVLSALAHGIPCVLSPVAAEGIGLRHRHDCMIVEKPDDWIKAIAALYGDDALWRKMSENARGYVAEKYSFARGREMMRAVLEEVGMFNALD